MREIWREKSALRRHRNQAMKIIGRVESSEGHYAQEKANLVDALVRKGLLAKGSSVDDVLQISVEHMLARRLQSVVYYRGLAPSMRAARNMIVHGHISIGDQRMTVPGYKIRRQEEEILQYKKHGLEFFAFWSWHDAIEPLIKKHGIRPQVWRTLPSPKKDTQPERVAAAAKAMLPLAKKTKALGLKLGLYNHGGWGGEPSNMVAVCQALRKQGHEQVGIVYNFHHGHGHVEDQLHI